MSSISSSLAIHRGLTLTTHKVCIRPARLLLAAQGSHLSRDAGWVRQQNPHSVLSRTAPGTLRLPEPRELTVLPLAPAPLFDQLSDRCHDSQVSLRCPNRLASLLPYLFSLLPCHLTQSHVISLEASQQLTLSLAGPHHLSQPNVCSCSQRLFLGLHGTIALFAVSQPEAFKWHGSLPLNPFLFHSILHLPPATPHLSSSCSVSISSLKPFPLPLLLPTHPGGIYSALLAPTAPWVH